MSPKNPISGPGSYIAWFIVSGLILPVGYNADVDYFLFAAAPGAAAFSALTVFVSVFRGWRPTKWALLAATPTIAAWLFIVMTDWSF